MTVENEFGQPIGNPEGDWHIPPRPSAMLLPGKHATLERLDFEKHAECLTDVFVKQTEPSQWTYLSYGPFPNITSFEAWLLNQTPSIDQSAQPSDPLFFVVRSSEKQILGMLSLMRIQPKLGSIEIGHIHFSSAMQQTPLSTESIFLLMRYAFDALGYRRLEWKCDALNARSRRAALRLGFRYEGTFRKHFAYKGRLRDTAWFSIVDDDWPAIRTALFDWLADENFEPDGKQLNRLQINARVDPQIDRQ